MPTPQEAADILMRFLSASRGSDAPSNSDQQGIGLADLVPSQPYDTQSNTYAPGTEMSVPSHNPNHFAVELPPLPADPSPFSAQSQRDRMAPTVGGVNIAPQYPLDWNRLPEATPRTPADANSGRLALAQMFGVEPPPTPAEAAGILGNDPIGANAPQALARNRSRLHDEFADRVSADKFAAALGPQTGYEPGSPGKRFVSNLPAANLAADQDQMLTLEQKMRADPFTGAEETARIGGIQKALDAAATTVRPEIDDAATALAKRNYFAEFMKSKGLKMGELSAAGSPEAYAAAMTPIRAAGSSESQDVLDAANRRALALASEKGNKPVKYSAPEQQLLDAANSVQELGPQLLALLEQENPGIGSNPDKFGSWTDVLGKEIGGRIYRFGKTQGPNRDAIDQMVGYLEAQIPKMLVPGRVNQQQYEDLKLHAPQLGFSDGANYRRLHEMLTTILPGVLHGMDEAHGKAPTSTALPGMPGAADKYAPPTPEEMATAGADNTNARADALLRRR